MNDALENTGQMDSGLSSWWCQSRAEHSTPNSAASLRTVLPARNQSILQKGMENTAF